MKAPESRRAVTAKGSQRATFKSSSQQQHSSSHRTSGTPKLTPRAASPTNRSPGSSGSPPSGGKKGLMSRLQAPTSSRKGTMVPVSKEKEQQLERERKAEAVRKAARDKVTKQQAQLWLALEHRSVTRLQAAYRGRKGRARMADQEKARPGVRERVREEERLRIAEQRAKEERARVEEEERRLLMEAEAVARAEREAAAAEELRVRKDEALRYREMRNKTATEMVEERRERWWAAGPVRLEITVRSIPRRPVRMSSKEMEEPSGPCSSCALGVVRMPPLIMEPNSPLRPTASAVEAITSSFEGAYASHPIAERCARRTRIPHPKLTAWRPSDAAPRRFANGSPDGNSSFVQGRRGSIWPSGDMPVDVKDEGGLLNYPFRDDSLEQLLAEEEGATSQEEAAEVERPATAEEVPQTQHTRLSLASNHTWTWTWYDMSTSSPHISHQHAMSTRFSLCQCAFRMPPLPCGCHDGDCLLVVLST